MFLGDGWTVGLANEAALKMREAAGAWTEAYPAMEYRHGPISANAVDHAGVADRPRRPRRPRGRSAGRVGVAPNALSPLAALVLAQRAAVALARPATSTLTTPIT